MFATLKRWITRGGKHATAIIVPDATHPVEDDWDRQRREDRQERQRQELEARARRIEDEYQNEILRRG